MTDTRTGYGVLPCAVMDRDDLTIFAKMLYVALASFAGMEEIRPGHKRLAQIVGCSERKIREALGELKAQELIEWRTIPSETGKISIYRLLGPWTGVRQEVPDPQGVRQDVPDGSGTTVQRGAAPGAGEIDKEQVDRKDIASPGFEAFWFLYPKKVNKEAAKRKWATTVRRVDPDVIIEGLRRYVDWINRSRKELQYVKGPDVWLNKGCWADELEPEAEAEDSLPEWMR